MTKKIKGNKKPSLKPKYSKFKDISSNRTLDSMPILEDKKKCRFCGRDVKDNTLVCDWCRYI